ncbi:hypothetical protein [Polaribacter sargassicola]|uniref:hypothetical protein n=1 Tax=Polaribacter sargassicola TaxID=2836891 RepID=UPI001F3287A2|nr:hypothetical protein [Polaribacter sp. DS7-9]MCG1035327.1 hypothetical protein [Polaribacter sp. DS7-9]
MQETRKDIVQFINLQLATIGQPIYKDDEGSKEQLCDPDFEKTTRPLIMSLREKSRLLSHHLSPADSRIQEFLDDYLKDVSIDKLVKLPNNTLILSKKGQAREASLPPNGNSFVSDLVTSKRLKQGILNNPLHDKRTTKGTFHIVEGNLPVPLDKFEVPKIVFAHFLNAAFKPSDDLNVLPFTSTQKEKAKTMVSMLLRPVVCPEVKGVISEKSLEVRFYAPGSLVSNLDFVESIFGNAGDPSLAHNDAALDPEHWTGHTGCIVLAPQLLKLKKKEVGLPHFDDATDRQKRDGMCWKDENELYNNGGAFKITCRDDRGVVVTLIADNYYGYSKKEIKTQISYSANLFGLAEEEHAGGAIAYARRVMGDTVNCSDYQKYYGLDQTFEDVKTLLADRIEVKPENYAVDKNYPNIIYIPEASYFDTNKNCISWTYKGKEQKLTLSPFKTYIHPSGNKLRLEKHKSINLWRMVETYPEGVFCHKPCTVSGGGKSEISKSMQNAITYGSFNIHNIEEDFKKADEIIEFDYSTRWKVKDPNRPKSRSLLSEKRTLGSVVKLLTPNEENSDEFNEFLTNIPVHVRTLVLFVKRLFRQAHGAKLNWKDMMSVEIINGVKGTSLIYNNTPVVGSYVRIGFNQEGNWMLNKLRSDFAACEKIQTEDDITASITLPKNQFKNLNQEYTNKSVKVIANCEAHLFQRPDEAIVRGYDKLAEFDIISDGRFLTNYEMLTKEDAIAIYEDTLNYDKYTEPVKNFIKEIIDSKEDNVQFVLPSHPRIVDREPTKNPRYLEPNKFYNETEASYISDVGVRLKRKIKQQDPVIHVVNAVLPGRRNNPADREAGIRPLAVYNPIHYQETPELFMDFICSLTGKSPSTTGAGSEGALTKAPFNMLTPTTDLNNALLSHILTESNGFSTAAGYVGAENKIDHDVSLLIPEIWARMAPQDRDPNYLIKNGALEKLEDFEHNGETILASRLGYRITKKFALLCLNRLFDEPTAVFNKQMLKPELQNLEDFVDGIKNICEAQQKVALNYFEDGSIEAAIPPLKILLNIMAYGHYDGKDISDVELRKYFNRDYVVNSDWYKERLVLKQQSEIKYLTNEIKYLQDFISDDRNDKLVEEMDIMARLEKTEQQLNKVKSDDYLIQLNGTIGLDPLCRK